MDIFTILIWVGTAIFLVFSFVKDKDKTKHSLKIAFSMGKGMLSSILAIIFLIGLILTFVPPESIAAYVGKQSTIVSTVICALFGAITLIPAFIAFPLVGTLVQAGVSITPAVAFLTTLTMVGVVTMPLEKQAFGIKFTIWRNVLSFMAAIAIALVMGVIL